jgi:undecaprenyl-diphosphatase
MYVSRIAAVTEYQIAIILGIVEGITEFLPISSTGHLILAGKALEFADDKAKIFSVVIQFGAISSVLVLYRQRFLALLEGSGRTGYLHALWQPGLNGSAGMLKLAMVTFPVLAIGFLCRDFIKARLFSPFPVAVAMVVGALVILLVERRTRDGGGFDAESLTWKQALIIGCIQCCSLWPGMSRAASAIIGGMLIGFNRKAATEFSFLAAVPALTAAALAEFFGAFHTMTAHDLELIAIGFVISFFTAIVSIKCFIGIVSRWSLRPFALYRLALAAVVLMVLCKK